MIKNLSDIDGMVRSVNNFVDSSFPVDNVQYQTLLETIIA